MTATLAPPPPVQVGLKELHTLTWRGFVRRANNGLAVLPKPWTPLRATLRTNRLQRVYAPWNQEAGVFIEHPRQTMPTLAHGHCAFPDYGMWSSYPLHAADVLLLEHPPALLAPDLGEREGYLIGPFVVAVVVHEGLVLFQATLPPDAPPRLDTWRHDNENCPHPNLMPSPCYGAGDWHSQFAAAADDQEWGDVLAVVHAFLSSWNHRDHPSGHPRDLCIGRAPWTAPPVFSEEDDEESLWCGGCDERFNPNTDDYYTLLEGDHVCGGCFEAGGYSRCVRCDYVFIDADIVRIDDVDIEYCTRCASTAGVFDCAACETLHLPTARSEGHPTWDLCDAAIAEGWYVCGVCAAHVISPNHPDYSEAAAERALCPAHYAEEEEEEPDGE